MVTLRNRLTGVPQDCHACVVSEVRHASLPMLSLAHFLNATNALSRTRTFGPLLRTRAAKCRPASPLVSGHLSLSVNDRYFLVRLDDRACSGLARQPACSSWYSRLAQPEKKACRSSLDKSWRVVFRRSRRGGRSLAAFRVRWRHLTVSEIETGDYGPVIGGRFHAGQGGGVCGGALDPLQGQRFGAVQRVDQLVRD